MELLIPFVGIPFPAASVEAVNRRRWLLAVGRPLAPRPRPSNCAAVGAARITHSWPAASFSPVSCASAAEKREKASLEEPWLRQALRPDALDGGSKTSNAVLSVGVIRRDWKVRSCYVILHRY